MEGDDGSSSPNSPFLLPIPSHHHHHANPNLLCGEVERQLRLAAPLVAASLLQYSLQLISAMFVGHLGELPLSAVSLASSFANVTGLSVLLGMGSALDTLCGQANGLSREAFHDVLDFLRLAVPSTFMICLEYWSFEMVVLLSGLLPNPMLETSVLSISLNTMWMVYMIPTGLGSAVSIRVSNELGSGNPQAARLSVRAVVIISVIEGVIVAIATILMRNIWGYLYSNEREVVKYVSVLIPLLAISDFMDGIQCVLSGAARGLGWQKTCSYINLGAYYIVGFPSSILFAFILHGGGKGLWMGIICALAVQVFVLLAMILHTDWDKETTKAGGRVHNSAVTAAATW